MKKVIASPDAPKAVGPYSQAIEAGGTLYISGQLPINPADGKIPETIEEQTAQSLDNTAAILKEAGYTFEDVVKTTVLLDDMHNFAAMNGYMLGIIQKICRPAYVIRWPNCLWA